MRGIVLLVAAVATSGCGFEWAPYRGGAVVGSVAIEELDNRSFEPGMESAVADALHRVFLRRGVFAIVDDAEQADLVIRGEIPPLVTRSRSFSSIRLALEYEVTLELQLDVQQGDGSVLELGSEVLRESEFYLASADLEALRKNRREALRRLADLIASRLHDALYEHLAQ